MKIEIKTDVFEEGIIKQSSKGAAGEEILRTVINTQEEHIKNALIALGWTPPNGQIDRKILLDLIRRIRELEDFDGHFGVIAALQEKLHNIWAPIDECPKTPMIPYDLFTVDRQIWYGQTWANGSWPEDWTDKNFTHYRRSNAEEPNV